VQTSTQTTTSQQSAKKQESVGKHLLSFAVMIVLTAIAFAAVGLKIIPNHLVIPVLLVMAAIQVFLQLFTFMHLDQKGSLFPIIFIFAGIFVAIVSAFGIFMLL
jgi:cytochrome c oxidase subunit IV